MYNVLITHFTGCFNLPNGGVFCPRYANYENINVNYEVHYIIPIDLWRKGGRQPQEKDYQWCVNSVTCLYYCYLGSLLTL